MGPTDMCRYKRHEKNSARNIDSILVALAAAFFCGDSAENGVSQVPVLRLAKLRSPPLRGLIRFRSDQSGTYAPIIYLSLAPR